MADVLQKDWNIYLFPKEQRRSKKFWSPPLPLSVSHTTSDSQHLCVRRSETQRNKEADPDDLLRIVSYHLSIFLPKPAVHVCTHFGTGWHCGNLKKQKKTFFENQHQLLLHVFYFNIFIMIIYVIKIFTFSLSYRLCINKSVPQKLCFHS